LADATDPSTETIKSQPSSSASLSTQQKATADYHRQMLRTPFCDLFGISVPLLLAPFGPWDEVELAAAVCESGALGSLGTALQTPAELREQ
jgi:hypothetical protein